MKTAPKEREVILKTISPFLPDNTEDLVSSDNYLSVLSQAVQMNGYS